MLVRACERPLEDDAEMTAFLPVGSSPGLETRVCSARRDAFPMYRPDFLAITERVAQIRQMKASWRRTSSRLLFTTTAPNASSVSIPAPAHRALVKAQLSNASISLPAGVGCSRSGWPERPKLRKTGRWHRGR